MFGPSRARAAKHPAPFPIELPKRLINLYTYRDGLVLDPFCGTGATAVAAMALDRRYIGIDVAEEYIEIARKES